MITTKQAPRRNSVHGPYVRVSVADLEVGNVAIYGAEPVTVRVNSLDRPIGPKLVARFGYRWINGQQRELRSWRDVLVSSLTKAQRAAIVEGKAVR